jgi:rod shape-determining protein MreD
MALTPRRPGLLSRLDALARGVFPVGVTAIVLILAATPVGLPGLGAAIALPSVVFWSLFRPAAIPPPAVFGLGLLQDLLAAAPLGTGILALLLAHGLAVQWRRALAAKSFLVVWLAFCGIAALAIGLDLVLHALLAWRALPPAAAAGAFWLTAGLYPAIAWALTRAHRAMRLAEGEP